MLFQACQVHYPKIDMGDGNGRFFLITMYLYLSIYLSISLYRNTGKMHITMETELSL